MKKNLLLIIGFFFFFTTVFAEKRELSDARSIANSFIATTLNKADNLKVSLVKTMKSSSNVPTKLELVYTSQNVSSNVPNYYVFEKSNSSGFVIISGDTRAEEVLAYSDNGSFDLNNMPSNMREWLSIYEYEMTELSKLTDAQYRANAQTHSSFQAAPTASVVSPLLGTMQWNQSAPYNDMCPMDGSERSVTGCTATAMAQVMRYHQHPATGIGSKSYNNNGQTLTVNFANSTYDWTNMTMQYDDNSTSIENAAVARLMYDCGVSIETDYSSTGSSAYMSDVAVALQTYFDYDDDIAELSYTNYTYNEWVNIFKQELNANRPVYHLGVSLAGGHAFVCDGYDTDDYFHFNWGWGGYCDGYFKLSALVPTGGGIGAGSADGYNGSRAILVGIHPNDNITSTTSKKVMVMDGVIESDDRVVARDGYLTLKLVKIWNKSYDTFVGAVGVALYNANDEYVEVVGSNSETLPTSYGWNELYIQGIVPASVAAGNYKIVPVYSYSPYTTWIKTGVNARAVNYLDVTITTDSIYLTTPSEFDVNLEVRQLEALTPIYQDRSAQFSFTIKNNGGEYMSNIDLKIGTSSYTYIEIKNPAVTILGGDSIQVTVTEMIDLNPGSYDMQLYYDETNSEQDAETALGSPVSITVNPTPTTSPNIDIASQISFADNNNVIAENAELFVTFTNTGGYGSLDEVYAIIWDAQTGSYLGMAFPIFSVTLEANETKTYTITGDIPFPAGQYTLGLRYVDGDNLLMFDNYNYADVNITIVDEVSFPTVADFDAFEALADVNNNVKITGDMTVVFQSFDALYVHDGDDIEMLISSDDSYENMGYALENGQTISNLIGRYTANGVCASQMDFDTIETIGSVGTPISPIVVNPTNIGADDINQYLRFENVEIAYDVEFTVFGQESGHINVGNNERLSIRNQFCLIQANFAAGDRVNVEGFFSCNDLYITSINECVNPDKHFKSGDLWYEITDSVLNTVKVIKSMEAIPYTLSSVIIPASVTNNEKSYTVTELEQLLFYQDTIITSLSLPGTIKETPLAAFGACINLGNITFGEGIETIGNQSFFYCPLLEDITIPSTVTYIDFKAFHNCQSLDSIVTLAITPPAMGVGPFEAISSNHKVYVPVGSEGAYIFAEVWKDMNIVLPAEGVGTMFKYNDYWYQILSKSPNTVQLVQTQDSVDYAVENVVIPQTVVGNGETYDVTAIGENAFFDNQTITSLSLPSTIKRIEKRAFYASSNISSLNLNEGLEYIGEEAFVALYDLQTLTLPSTLKEMGNWSFNSPRSLNTINVLSVVPPMVYNPYIFYGLPSTHIVNIPAGTAAAYIEAMCWQDLNLNIPVGELGYRFQDGDYWFQITDNVNNIVRVVTPAGGVYNLNNVIIPDNATNNGISYVVNEIGVSAFANSDSLRTVTISSSVTKMNRWAFTNDVNLQSVTFSEGLEYIGERAFNECTSLASILLPSTLDTICELAFHNCSALTMIRSAAINPPKVGFEPFYGVDNSIPVYVHSDALNTYKNANVWANFTNYPSVVIMYDANGGIGTMANQIVTPSFIDNLDANLFTRAGHTFMGWSFEDPDGPVHFTDQSDIYYLCEDVRTDGLVNHMYAIWSTTTVDAPVFSHNTGNFSTPFSLTITAASGAVIHYTTDLTPPNSSSPIYTAPINISSTTTVKAIAVLGGNESAPVSATYTYVKPTYTLKFLPNGGIGTANHITVTENEAIGVLPVVTRDGFTFAGWQIDGVDITSSTIWTYTEDKIAVAQWRAAAETYTLSFLSNGGIGTANPITVIENEAIGTLPIVTRDGFTFVEWQIDGEAIDASTIWTYTEDKIAVAQWIEAAETYTLSFILNGGVGTANPITVTENQAIGTLPVVTRDEFTFVEWQIDGEAIDASTIWTYTEDKIAVALWDKITAIDNVELVNITIYPNPTENILYINVNEQVEKYELFSTSGTLILEAKSSGVVSEIQVDMLAPGTYILRTTLINGDVHNNTFIKK